MKKCINYYEDEDTECCSLAEMDCVSCDGEMKYCRYFNKKVEG